MNIEEKIKTVLEGKPLILLDEKSRENEGDLMFPAEIINRKIINFMMQNAGGMICVPISKKISRRLDLPPMVENNREHYGSRLTVSADAASGISTGVSAKDKEKTIKIIADPDSKPSDLVRPGHIFPIIANKRGLRGRKGHTEMSIEICRRLGFKEAAVIAELIDKDGKVLRGKALDLFAKRHSLQIVQLKELV
jgi:3,4-dihydroxy 2-butanone 4-phosphate synthase/GTP cyclohydrolase II